MMRSVLPGDDAQRPRSRPLPAASGAWSSSAASRPELLTRQPSAFGHGPHLGPADVRVDTVAVAAIGAGDDILAPHDPSVGHNAIRDQCGGLDGRGLVSDDPRDVDLALGQLDVFPELPIQL